jgi:outer membrane protein assembly factor BamA
VLALRSGGGMATGTFARRGIYFVGGYNLANTGLLDTITSGAFNGAFVLRGYPPGAYRGSTYLLQTAEYRFPIAITDIGPSTLPLYLRRIDGNLFFDYGGAFDKFDFRKVKFFSRGSIIDTEQLHTSVGAELWLGASLAYVFDVNFRLGYAFGFSHEAIPGGQLYFLASSAF